MYRWLVVLLVFSTPGFGALSPSSQRIVEMRAILDSPDLTKNAEGEMIESITYKPNQRYEIVTSDSVIDVHILYLPSKRMGPVPFELQFDKR